MHQKDLRQILSKAEKDELSSSDGSSKQAMICRLLTHFEMGKDHIAAKVRGIHKSVGKDLWVWFL